MRDGSILTLNYLENPGTLIIYQLFVNGREQLTKGEVKKSKTIASVRTYKASNTTYSM